jgi:hypothetical protein
MLKNEGQEGESNQLHGRRPSDLRLEHLTASRIDAVRPPPYQYERRVYGLTSTSRGSIEANIRLSISN